MRPGRNEEPMTCMEKKQKNSVTVISYYGTMEKHLKSHKTELMFPQITSTAMLANSKDLIKDKALGPHLLSVPQASADVRWRLSGPSVLKFREVSGVQKFFSCLWSDTKNWTLNQDLLLKG